VTNLSEKLQSMREHYDQPVLRKSDLSSCPFEQFTSWLEDAVAGGVYDPNACSLATVDEEGRPVARAVLLKGLEAEEFVFYTNYNSRKARHLLGNPNACLHFPWFSLQRQVTVLGKVTKLDDDRAEQYFRSRPHFSKLGAWASNQSEELESREELEKAFLEAEEKFGEDPPKPTHWGGFALTAHSIEFWQGGPSRLHDRLVYEKEAGAWSIRRLNP